MRSEFSPGPVLLASMNCDHSVSCDEANFRNLCFLAMRKRNEMRFQLLHYKSMHTSIIYDRQSLQACRSISLLLVEVVSMMRRFGDLFLIRTFTEPFQVNHDFSSSKASHFYVFFLFYI